MSTAQAPAQRSLPTALGVVTLLSVVVLLTFDAMPRLFRAEAHDQLAALPLILIAVAYVVYQAARRRPTEWAKAMLLALAFLFWAANLLCSNHVLARLFNDIAIAAFVFDAFLVITGGTPGTDPGKGDAEQGSDDGLSSSRAEPLPSTVVERA